MMDIHAKWGAERRGLSKRRYSARKVIKLVQNKREERNKGKTK